MKKLILLLVLLLTTAWPASSQRNSDSIKIHKDAARKAIKASRENVLLRQEVDTLRAYRDTVKVLIFEQEIQIRALKDANMYERKLSSLSQAEAHARGVEADAQRKEARKFRRQRNIVAAGGILITVLSIIFI